MAALSMAIVKDCYEEEERSTILAILQSLSFIAPLAAPILGGIILKYVSWKGVFISLGVVGIINLILVFFFEETLPISVRNDTTILKTWKKIFVVGKNTELLKLLITFAIFFAPYMTYVSISSYIFINYFKLTEQTYSYFFAINSALNLLGPMVYLRLKSRLKSSQIINRAIWITILGGVFLITVAKASPIIFLLIFMPYTLIISGLRPLINNILLSMEKEDTGTTSGLINFIYNGTGSIAMALGGISIINPIVWLGIIILVSTLITLFSWRLDQRNSSILIK